MGGFQASISSTRGPDSHPRVRTGQLRFLSCKTQSSASAPPNRARESSPIHAIFLPLVVLTALPPSFFPVFVPVFLQEQSLNRDPHFLKVFLPLECSGCEHELQ